MRAYVVVMGSDQGVFPSLRDIVLYFLFFILAVYFILPPDSLLHFHDAGVLPTIQFLSNAYGLFDLCWFSSLYIFYFANIN